jgi:hypothetical protein
MWSAIHFLHGLASETERPIGIALPGPDGGPTCSFVLPDSWTALQFVRWIEPMRHDVKRDVGDVTIIPLAKIDA